MSVAPIALIYCTYFMYPVRKTWLKNINGFVDSACSLVYIKNISTAVKSPVKSQVPPDLKQTILETKEAHYMIITLLTMHNCV